VASFEFRFSNLLGPSAIDRLNGARNPKRTFPISALPDKYALGAIAFWQVEPDQLAKASVNCDS
jgi:hypothetical protein